MKRRVMLLFAGILVGVSGLFWLQSSTQSAESALPSKPKSTVQDKRDAGKVNRHAKSAETATKAETKPSESRNQLKVTKEDGLTSAERKDFGSEGGNRPFNSVPVSQGDLASAPKSARYPSLEVHAYRSVKLPPRTKGGLEGELREWLVKPSKEGYEHHLEEEYYPDDKGEMSLFASREYVANQVMLTVDGECSDEEFAQRVAAFGGRAKQLMTIEKGRRLVAVDVPEITLDTVAELTERLGGDKDASGISPDYVNHAISTPNDTSFSSQWGMTKIKAPQAWNITTDASSVLVAVLDSGIYYNHVDLNANMWVNPSQGSVAGFTSDQYGARCIAGVKSGNPLDDNGHGTHCAGVIGAVGNNSKGVAGVAWRTKLMALKFLDSSGGGYDSDAIVLMDYARQKNVKIISCSFGGAGYNSSMYSALSTLRNNGIIVVCAAGNEGTSNDTIPHYPSSYSLDNIVAVASTTSSDTLSSFSCYGSTSVDIAAPGDSIYSTYNSSTTSYVSMSGTSMATPHVAGALALVRAYFPSDNYLSLIQRLYNGGDTVSSLSGKVMTGKRLNVLGALSGVVPPAPTITASKGTYADKVVVTWPVVGGATHYRVYRGTSSSGSSATALGSGWQTSCTFNDTTGTANVTYYYFVKAATSSSGANASDYSAYSTGWRTGVATYPDVWDPNDDSISGTTNVLSMSTTPTTQYSHGLNANDLYDFYKVYLNAGKRYVFESTGDYDMYGELFNTTSTNSSYRVAYNDDGGTNLNFMIDYIPPSSGYYYLRVRRYSVGSVGWYNLKYYQIIAPDAWDPADDTASGGTSLTPATTVLTHGPHTLTSSDCYDFFKISMTAGRTYTFESTYGDVYGGDMYGELFSSTSTNSSYRVAYNDDGGTQTLQFKIVYTPTSSGYYYLRVRRYSVGQTGEYSLKYSMTVPETHDLVYYRRSGMPAAVYVANRNGSETLVGSTRFTTNDTIYVHYAFTDATDNDIDRPFTNKVELLRYTSSGSYSVVGYVYDDYPQMEGGSNWRNAGGVYITDPEVGDYGVRITLNTPQTISETNYVNNTFIERYTVTAPVPSKRLVSLAIEGRSSIPSGTSSDYTARASFSDGTSESVTPTWQLSPSTAPASIDARGHLTARDVSVNESFTISASYTFDGVTQTGTKSVTVTAGGTPECPFGATVQYPVTPMTVFAAVTIDGERASEGDVLAAFVGDELRGRIELDANGRRAINIYVTSPSEEIRFRTWSRGDGEVYACTTPLSGVVGGEQGSPSSPYQIDCASSDPFTVPVQYPNPPMTILARVVIKGQPAERGDMVGVFCGSELRAKGAVHMESGVACVTLAPSISSVGETLTFKVWDASEAELLNATGTLRGEIGGEAGTPSNRYLIEVTDSVTQTIELNGSTWQFISVNVTPEDNAIRRVLSSVLADVDRVTCGDRVFRPSWSDSDNTLATIEPGKGYWVHRSTTGSKNLQITGAPVDVSTTTVTLTTGWNAIGYLPQQPGQIRAVLANVLASGKINRVTAGDQVFNPSWSDDDNTLNVMRPGIGYWVRATGATTFSYVDSTGNMVGLAMAVLAAESAADHPWGDVRDTDPVVGCTLRAGLSLFGVNAVYGDAYVAAFAGENTVPCCVATVNSEGNLVMNIQKNLPTTLRFEVWDARAGVKYDSETTMVINPGEDEHDGETIVVSGSTPEFTVTFVLDGENGGTGSRVGGGALVQAVERCGEGVAPEVMPADGYEFLMWDADFDCVKCDMVIHAVYQVLSPSEDYETFYFNGNGADSGTMPVAVHDSSDPFPSNAFARDGYEFLGWALDPNATEPLWFDDGTWPEAWLYEPATYAHTVYAVWRKIRSGETAGVGDYFKKTLAELGFDVPTNGTVYSVTAYGLPAGLKLVKSPAVTKKVKSGGKTKTVVLTPAGVNWWIEGVSTAALDSSKMPTYLTIKAGGSTTTVPLLLTVNAQEVVDLGAIPVGVALNEQHWLPGLGSGWSVSGLPTGLKYTAKLVTTKTTKTVKKRKVTTVTTNALPDSVYGKPTKAGLYTITAKKKVSGYYETQKYRVLVTPKDVDTALFGEGLGNRESMAYAPFEWNLLDDVAAVGGKVAKVTGLPTGLAFAAANTYAYKNAKKKTGKYLKQAGQTIVGTPTKPGTFVVTFTKNVKSGKKTVAKTAQILWVVTKNEVGPQMDFNTAGGVIEQGVVGVQNGDAMSFNATEGAKVTASGLPSGVKLVDLGGGRWGFTGFATKTGNYLVTVKATLNGNTVSQRLELLMAALPAWAKGTFTGTAVAEGELDGHVLGLATVSASSAGKLSGKFVQGGTNWTLSASSYGGIDDEGRYFCTNLVASYSYKVKSGKKTVTKTIKRRFELAVAPDPALPERGQAVASEVEGEVSIIASQNLWASAYKAIGKKLFYTSKNVQYRTYTIGGASLGLKSSDKLTLKVTPAGAVTATLTFDTGKKSKGKRVVYKPTCSTTVVPTSPSVEGAAGFTGRITLFFKASAANAFEELTVELPLESNGVLVE